MTIGVDLAAEPANTGLAVLEWTDGRARLVQAEVGVDDEDILDASSSPGSRAMKTGIDAPFGWPAPFVRFLCAQAEQAPSPTGPASPSGPTSPANALPALGDRDARRPLVLRTTDLQVRRSLGMTPLSVSTDRIGIPAMRCAGLRSALADRCGVAVPRDGSGPAVEVYPAATLKQWSLPFRGYKRAANRGRLAEVVDRLLALAPWLDLGVAASRCRRDDHLFDAVLCALTARAHALGLTLPPSPEQEPLARIEGWIAVPTHPTPSALRRSAAGR